MCADRFCACYMHVLEKCLVQNVVHFSSTEWISMIQPPVYSCWSALQYKTGAKLCHPAVHNTENTKNYRPTCSVISPFSQRFVMRASFSSISSKCRGDRLYHGKFLGRRHHQDGWSPSVLAFLRMNLDWMSVTVTLKICVCVECNVSGKQYSPVRGWALSVKMAKALNWLSVTCTNL